MPWFKLDERFHSHPKVIAAGNEATGLYVRCGAYAAEHLTDGFIPEQVALSYGTPALAEALVRAKLWRRTRGGWRMPDYLDYNPSKESVEKQRKDAAERQRRSREQRLSRVTHTAPIRSEPYDSNGVANTTAARAAVNGGATRQPPPFDEAVRRALNPPQR